MTACIGVVTAPREWGIQPQERQGAGQGTGPMSDHKHGEMDIKAHERTFDGFIRALTWSGGISIVVLIFIALVNS